MSYQALLSAKEQTYLHHTNFKGGIMQSFIFLQFPYALPMLATGWKSALSTSIIGAVVSEFILGSSGLGSLINISKSRFDTTTMFVALLWLSLIGICYFLMTSFLEKKIGNL